MIRTLGVYGTAGSAPQIDVRCFRSFRGFSDSSDWVR